MNLNDGRGFNWKSAVIKAVYGMFAVGCVINVFICPKNMVQNTVQMKFQFEKYECPLKLFINFNRSQSAYPTPDQLNKSITANRYTYMVFFLFCFDFSIIQLL